MVRENITAYIIPPSTCFYLVNSKNSFEPNSNSEKLFSSVELTECKTVIIRAGDILQIDGEIYLQSNFESPKNAKKLIKCLVKRRLKLSSATAEAKSDDINKHAEVLYLPEDTLGRYSPVARIENISGVHKLVDLVKKFRFPVTVQLVYGRAPPVTDTSSSLSSSNSSVSFSNSNRFTPILKLLKIYEEENIFAYPVGKESCLIQIPTHTKLSMIKANNMNYLIENSSYLRSILNECKNLAPEYSDMINCLPKSPPQSILDGLDNLNTGIIQSCVKSLVGRAVLFENSSEVDLKETSHNSLLQKKLNSSDDSNNNSCGNTHHLSSSNRKSECFLMDGEDENKAYDEIDRLYEYVRTGVLPETCVPEKVAKTSKHEKIIKNIKKSGSLLKLCQNNSNDQPPLPIRIKITSHADQSNGSKNNNNSNNLKRQQSITHLLASNPGLNKSRDDLRTRASSSRKKYLNQITNNSNNSMNQTNDDDTTSKEIIDYYCAKSNSSQIKRSASLNKLDSFNSKTSNTKVNNNVNNNNNNINANNINNNTKVTQVRKQIVPKLVFPIVKHTKKVNFSGVNQYQQVLPPPPVITKPSNKNIKPIELKLSDLTELANIKAIVSQNNKLNINSDESKTLKQNGKTNGKIQFNIYNNIDNDNTYKTDYSVRQQTYNEPSTNKSNKFSYNLRKNEYFDSLQTLNDYDISSSNNIPNGNNNLNNKTNLYHSFGEDITSGEDENFFYEENENYYLRKSQFAPFGNSKSNADMTMMCSNERLNAINAKKKVKIYARNEYANKKALNNNINTHGLRNYSSMEKLQIIRLQKY